MNISDLSLISLNLMVSNLNEIEKSYKHQFDTLKFIKQTIFLQNDNVIDKSFVLPSLNDLFCKFNGKKDKLKNGKFIYFGKYKSLISGNVILFGKLIIKWNGDMVEEDIRYPAYIKEKLILMDDESIDFYIKDLIKDE